VSAALVAPALSHERSYLAALREGFRRGIQPALTPAEIAAVEADFPAHIARITAQGGTLRLASGELLPKVPFTLLWLAAGEGFIGEVSIRHELNRWLRVEGGHIGYGIRPSLQRQGYGRLILALALEECRALGLPRVLLTAQADNHASLRIIEANGGELEDEAPDPSGHGRLRRYWLAL
jgi:predicted acetyltransferase